MADAFERPSEKPVIAFFMSTEEVASRNWPQSMPAGLRPGAERLVANGLWDGTAGAVEFYHAFDIPHFGHVLFTGLGPATALTDAGLRAAGATAARLLMSRGLRSMVAALSEPSLVEGASIGYADAVRALMEGALFASHRLPSYGAGSIGAKGLQIEFAGAGSVRPEIEPVARAKAAGVAFARDLAMTPSNRLMPRQMAEKAIALTVDSRVEATLLDPDALHERGFGAILAVAGGSDAEALLVHLRYRPEDPINPGRPIVLVGKSVTFDSGGISLKPALDMDRMKADMAGGAAIMGALKAALDLSLPVEIDLLLPIVENMPGRGAMRPGDVIDTYSGKTVEVLNTDAEGRLILADALAFAKTLAPECVIDLATLTGASAIVFGPYGIGVFVNDLPLKERLFAADAYAGEKLWQLPLWEEYTKLLRSDVADLANISSTLQKGSMMTAASFLQVFIAPVPWAHLDIYNSAWSEIDHPVFGKGPTGAGVATLVELLLARCR